MKKIILAAAALSALIAGSATFASEQAPLDNQNTQGTQATCYAYDIYGRQYVWLHPVPAVASQMVMNACFSNTGYACTPGGCTF